MRVKALTLVLASVGCVDVASAARSDLETDAAKKLERVEVTGSSIRRIGYEGALPVQTVTRTDIEQLGVQSTEQLVATLAANGNGADNLSSNVGIAVGTSDRNNNGNSSASLRGLGAGSTLVLLNGRRVPAHGAKGHSVDLNWIPLAAIERVEVLKDGASAIYGADAIGGVLNFITRTDTQGFELGSSSEFTEAGGAALSRGQIHFGLGDLDQSGHHLMLALGVDQQQRLEGSDREFVNGFQPGRGLSPDTTGTPFATQVAAAGTAIASAFVLPGGAQSYNRANLLAFEGDCASVAGMSAYQSDLWGSPGSAYGCAFDYGATQVLIQPVDRVNLLARGQWALDDQHRVITELVGSRVDAQKRFEPYQITTSTAALAAARYPVGGRYYQDLSPYVPGFNNQLPIAYRWRCDDCGQRTIDTNTDAYRVLVGLEGLLSERWDYRLGLSTAGSSAQSRLGHGYYYTAGLISALGSGDLDLWLRPGQAQDAAGLARLNAASAAGERLFDGRSGLLQLDGSVSGEWLTLPAGPIAVAAGFDLRRETYAFSDGSTTTQPIFQAPFDAEFPRVEREISALFTEVAVPITSQFEASLALRHDHYSDFGGTTNPKLSLKYTPNDALLLRGSINTGFRAPSFFQLYTAQSDAPVPGNIADPVLCPAGNVPGADLSVCAIRPDARQGGNPQLQPETSRQWSLGLVAAPTDWLELHADWWHVERDQLIVALTPQEVIANYTTFPDNLVRGSDGRLDGPGGYIRAGFVNADGDITEGLDLGLDMHGELGAGRWSLRLDSTYLDSHRARIFSDEPRIETVGRWNNRDLHLRWKHLLQLGYSRGDWSATLHHQYASGYEDQVPSGLVPTGFDGHVEPWSIYGLSLAYTGIQHLDLRLGIRNLFDTDPPFTAHNIDFSPGTAWDPRVADPRGRSFQVNAGWRWD